MKLNYKRILLCEILRRSFITFQSINNHSINKKGTLKIRMIRREKLFQIPVL